jgi:hypothetical protein
MQRLDRLGWAAGLAFRSFGVRIGVRATDPSVLDEVKTILPPGWTPLSTPKVSHLFSIVTGGATQRRGVHRMWVLYDGWVREARARTAEPVVEALESALRTTVAEHSPNRVFVHAGAVAWKGKAIIVPGPSFSGKSTLITELVRRGATYYSDEYAVLDARGRVHPFAAAPSLRPEGSYRGEKQRADEFDPPATGTKPMPVGMVFIGAYKEGVRFRPRSLTGAEGALEMLANTVPIRRRPSESMTALKAAASGATILKGSRGEAGAVAKELLSRLEG